MKARITVLLLIITFVSNAQDSLNFSLLEFKNIKEREFLLYARWNYERPCDIPEVLMDMYPSLDTNYRDGTLLTAKEKDLLHLDQTDNDTIEKYGKIEMGNYVAYIIRHKFGNQPQYMMMHLYNQKGQLALSFGLAG